MSIAASKKIFAICDPEENYAVRMSEYLLEKGNMEAIFSSGIAFGTLENYNDFTSERDMFTVYHQKLNEVLTVCSSDTFKRADGYFNRAILNVHSASCNLVWSRLTDCLNEMGKLDNWCHF